ncbi:hypothetical protein CANTEDRAFT_116014 [Yamadazyma tenuis ATCC 10573]|uniref:Uncharacterized protein n=1 Tax=Candida tenuis (strain ATCC 10573 / BCRC 21748 / CBS 615 / JCM 9827 / NBRC 10315 / NRRL Y-1498 / VKM Y-70) TaxID=590646 RepID=G3BF16_CANTC|nr:uncharacterized protein CANTEDRAFT_116014 [Yamadazyma tenuis ATCC 10573]EGV59987.1 hypothetical protein CANTEDRAFT_116014 [Yamadazyma tenuis ATCC 10573]
MRLPHTAAGARRRTPESHTASVKMRIMDSVDFHAQALARHLTHRQQFYSIYPTRDENY